jgi:two-component system chemotaxis sensor kinase CheA
MAGELGGGLRDRLGIWRSQLWQVYEAQYEPFSAGDLQRYLRQLMAFSHLAGLETIASGIDDLSMRLTEPQLPEREEVENEVFRLLGLLDETAEGVADPPRLGACVIHIAPGQGFLDSSLDLSLVFADLAKLGQLEVMPDIDTCPVWEQFDPARCTMRWDLVLLGTAGADRVRDSLDFLASEPDMKITLEEDASPTVVQQLRRRALVAPIADNPSPTPENPAGYRRRASDREAPDAPAATQAQAPGGGASIRMSIERLDKIINSVGELVTAQVRLNAAAGRLDDPSLATCAEEIERLTLILRDSSMGLRMQPVGALFSRFGRLVRDLSQSLGKEVDFTVEGEETEIDRTVVEKLYDPLVHLIRNSLDHGLESPDERAKAGKPPRGSVRLRAYQQGSEVVIEVADDGAGINADRVLAKAIEKGLVRADVQLGFHEILDLIFLPGFSTAAAVSDVSGRGVGMDVVKSNVEALRGQIDIQSEPGKSSVMRLRFPLTMAIIDGLCVELAGEKYILPLDPVEECLDLSRYGDEGKLAAELDAGRQGLYYNLRGDGVSIFNLASVLAPGHPAGNRVIILRTFRGDRVALVVDTIVGRQQVVIKPLGPLHALRKELSGATIMGDGSIALVLDLPSIIRRLMSENYAGRNIALT